MSLASVEDVAIRSGQPIPAEIHPRVTALLEDVTGLIEDYCGKDFGRRTHRTITLYAQGGYALSIPARYRTGLTVSAVDIDGQEVTDWTYTGLRLVRDAGWGEALVTLTASWGHEDVPASLRAITCAEVIRWLALSPGVESERVGEVEVTFTGASSAQTLSAAAKSALREGRWRRGSAGSLSLIRGADAL